MSIDDLEELASTYNTRKDGSVNYRELLDAIEVIPKNLELSPRKPIVRVYMPHSHPLTDSQTPVTPKAKSARLDDQSEGEFLALLQRLKHVYKFAGINVLACYREFDHLTHGKVTVSQVRMVWYIWRIYRRYIPIEAIF